MTPRHVAALFAATALLATGCGGGDDRAAFTDQLDALCSAAEDAIDEITEDQSDIDFDDLADEYQSLADDIADLPAPGGDDADLVDDLVESFADTAETLADGAAGDASELGNAIEQAQEALAGSEDASEDLGSERCDNLGSTTWANLDLPTDTAPVETVPVETTAVETVPVETTPVATSPDGTGIPPSGVQSGNAADVSKPPVGFSYEHDPVVAQTNVDLLVQGTALAPSLATVFTADIIDDATGEFAGVIFIAIPPEGGTIPDEWHSAFCQGDEVQTLTAAQIPAFQCARAVSNLNADPPLGVMIVNSDDGGRLLDLLDAWFFAQGD
jgi:hypothetical protein